MATKIKSKKKGPDILDVEVRKGDIEKTIEKFKENPVLYCAVAGFIFVCIVAGLVYRLGSQSSTISGMTKFARSVETEDPALRATELESLAKGKSAKAAEAVYMMGEAALEAKEYDKAKAAFERLRAEFADSSFTPDAVEGLGFIAENAGQYDQAVASYKEIIEKWPATFAKRRQQFNIARCQEAAGNLKDAVLAYKAESDEFPGSSLDKDAKAALDRLRSSNPDLFPKEEPAPALEAGAAAQPAANETAKPAEQPAAVDKAPATPAEAPPAAQEPEKPAKPASAETPPADK